MFETDPNEQVKRDLRRLADDMSALKNYWVGEGRVSLDKMREEAKHKWSEASEEIKNRSKQADQYVRERPWSAVGLAAAIGALVGIILSSKRRR